MSKTRDKGIIAYGTEEDRQKLAILADTYGVSGSELLIKMIRERFEQLFGENVPKIIRRRAAIKIV